MYTVYSFVFLFILKISQSCECTFCLGKIERLFKISVEYFCQKNVSENPIPYIFTYM